MAPNKNELSAVLPLTDFFEPVYSPEKQKEFKQTHTYWHEVFLGTFQQRQSFWNVPCCAHLHFRGSLLHSRFCSATPQMQMLFARALLYHLHTKPRLHLAIIWSKRLGRIIAIERDRTIHNAFTLQLVDRY